MRTILILACLVVVVAWFAGGRDWLYERMETGRCLDGGGTMENGVCVGMRDTK
ncbi:hypothetical protein [Flaviflagellibacter deserti]|uniref:DUF3551 domain-containing protein n=1 Tax=Flaviflagellibacter deserti TaxID=2267266 RepID=A0ABV9YX59_9HYPH